MKPCLGQYEGKDGCDGCPVVLLCIDVAMDLDGYFDELADRQLEIEEMEQDARWTQGYVDEKTLFNLRKGDSRRSDAYRT